MNDARSQAIAAAAAWFDEGGLLADVRRRVAFRTESQERERAPELARYLIEEIGPAVQRLGFRWKIWDNPAAGAPPMCFAERIEDPALPTMLTYGHGDVVAGYDKQWAAGRSPWEVAEEDGRWFGRGTADNKGQHSINLAALDRVLAARGRLGFNVKLLIEMGEEVGSPGLREVCERNAKALSADLLIASDGPRLRSDRPTIFLGSRGAFNFDLVVDLRKGGHHSGNWGGLLANPGTILANAIASMVDARGRILVDGLRPTPIPQSVRRALADIEPGEPNGPEIDDGWGEPGLTAAERVLRMERARSARVSHRQSRPARQRDSTARERAHAGSLRRRLRLAQVRPGDAHASRHARLRQGRDPRIRFGADGRHASRSGSSCRAVGGKLDRGDDRRTARDPSESWRVAAERLFCRGSFAADDLGAALLSGVLAARARRAHAGEGRARRPDDHDRIVLGSRRSWIGAGAREAIGRCQLNVPAANDRARISLQSALSRV
jgi:acetylornithine deacetylase/succinyl-diaminopimelate desuccinylase-like protein